jgi:hypothetical protein
MNLKDLGKSAVRSAGPQEKVTGLGARELKTVVGGIVGDDTPTKTVDPQPSGPVTPEQCAIHFYYPTDATL